MLLVRHYSVRARSVGRLELHLPMRVQLSPDSWAMLSDEDTDLLALEVRRRVPREQLTVLPDSGWWRQAHDGLSSHCPGSRSATTLRPRACWCPTCLRRSRS
jgi:hypothetical protein